ncbi:MAG: type I-E CRISPR-associated protein Cse1/CasA [Chloroflexi bacterium]|nr:type I-E CRISPR-associated protein Cse1/CasA [Chloroflexota bacterium]
MPSFDLVDEPWIPCTMAKDGSHKEMGLREVLVQATEIREVADPSPLVTVALHRLLLAILHRNFGPGSTGEWKALCNAGRWGTEALDAYSQKWRHRFDVFDPKHPFYQVAGLGFSREATAARLWFQADNGPTLFDHTVVDVPPTLTPSQAAKWMLGLLAFDVGGTKTAEHGQASADAAPLTKGAVALLKGQNLFMTLMLNLHCYCPADAEPFPTSADDAPAWEHNDETKPEDRYPKGYLDLLTWQSRRILLHPEQDAAGNTVVRKAVIMKGNQFPDGFDRHSHETMVAFRRVDKPTKGQDPWPPVSFQEERALWRDSLSLFQSVEEQQARPRTLNWLNDLVSEGALGLSQTLQMDLLGLRTNPAPGKTAQVIFWRHERLPLPLAYLEDKNKDLLDKLREALQMAEEVGKALWSSVNLLAKLIVIPNWDQLSEVDRRRQEGISKKDIGDLVDSLAPERAYWPQLETPFKQLLVGLSQDKNEVEKDVFEYGVKTLPQWAETVRRAAWDAFDGATRSLDTTARALKAVSLAQRQFNWRINDILGPYLKARGGGA